MGRKKKVIKQTDQPLKKEPQIPVYSIEFIQISDVVPQEWFSWFWEVIADGAPFTWGDNDYSIIAIADFINWCERVLDPDEEGIPPQAELDAFYKKLRSFNNTWLDLECKILVQ